MNESERLDLWERLAQKFSLIPVYPDSKEPIEKKWHRWCVKKRPWRRADFEGGENAAICTGRASKLLGLDVDDPVLFAETIEDHNVEMPKTLTVHTGRADDPKRVHVYFRWVKGPYYWFPMTEMYGFTLKGYDGALLAPGSMVPGKGLYTVVDDSEPADIPEWFLLTYLDLMQGISRAKARGQISKSGLKHFRFR